MKKIFTTILFIGLLVSILKASNSKYYIYLIGNNQIISGSDYAGEKKNFSIFFSKKLKIDFYENSCYSNDIDFIICKNCGQLFLANSNGLALNYGIKEKIDSLSALLNLRNSNENSIESLFLKSLENEDISPQGKFLLIFSANIDLVKIDKISKRICTGLITKYTRYLATQINNIRFIFYVKSNHI